MNIYDFVVKNSEGKDIKLDKFKGKVLLIVNTASKCGLTPQYKELEELYKALGNEKFEILGFPCNQFAKQEPGSDAEIKNFCLVNYGVSFNVFGKIDVNGKDASPLFEYLRKEQGGLFGDKIKWNFTKFLIDADGKVIDRFAPTTSPLKIESKIRELIEK